MSALVRPHAPSPERPERDADPSLYKDHVDDDEEEERPCSPPIAIGDEVQQGLRRRNSPTVRRRVFWRTETSLSDDDDSTTSSSHSSTNTSVLTASPKRTVLTAAQIKEEDDDGTLLVPQDTYSVVRDNQDDKLYVEVDLEKYMSSREMTPFQERINAITMVPVPIFCFLYLVSGNWISPALLSQAREQLLDNTIHNDDLSCLDWSSSDIWVLKHFHALPPLPLLAVALGCALHSPFSFLYHWKYAHALSPTARTQHWSRRLDQSMLHITGAFNAFGTTGSPVYFWITLLFNLDSVVKQFETQVIPIRNQSRLGISIVLWLLPVCHISMDLFWRIFWTTAFALFLFIKYPIGGWSHAAFHLVSVLLPPLIMEAALSLPISQEPLQNAAMCMAMAQDEQAWEIS